MVDGNLNKVTRKQATIIIQDNQKSQQKINK